MPTMTAGSPAPAIELKNLQDKNFSLNQALGRGPVLAAFFKVGCPTCQFTLPFVERLYQQFRNGAITICGVSQDDAKDTRKFANQYGITFPLLIDDEPYEVSQEYKLEYTPTLFMISPERRVEFVSEGFSKRDLLAIQKTLAAQLHIASQPLFLPKEHVPEYKPG